MSFYKFAMAVVKGFYRIAFRIKVEGIENIAKDGAFVVCANHKSLLDAPLLGVCLPMEIKFMAKEELFRNKLFGSVLRALGAFPVKRGKSDIGALKAAIGILKSGEKLGIFPEGTRSPKGYMNKGKSGAALIAIKARVNILPVGICTSYRPFSKVTVRIGKPIELDEYFDLKTDSEMLQEITDTKIMAEISRLSEVSTYENRDC